MTCSNNPDKCTLCPKIAKGVHTSTKEGFVVNYCRVNLMRDDSTEGEEETFLCQFPTLDAKFAHQRDTPPEDRDLIVKL